MESRRFSHQDYDEAMPSLVRRKSKMDIMMDQKRESGRKIREESIKLERRKSIEDKKLHDKLAAKVKADNDRRHQLRSPKRIEQTRASSSPKLHRKRETEEERMKRLGLDKQKNRNQMELDWRRRKSSVDLGREKQSKGEPFQRSHQVSTRTEEERMYLQSLEDLQKYRERKRKERASIIAADAKANEMETPKPIIPDQGMADDVSANTKESLSDNLGSKYQSESKLENPVCPADLKNDSTDLDHSTEQIKEVNDNGQQLVSEEKPSQADIDEGKGTLVSESKPIPIPSKQDSNANDVLGERTTHPDALPTNSLDEFSSATPSKNFAANEKDVSGDVPTTDQDDYSDVAPNDQDVSGDLRAANEKDASCATTDKDASGAVAPNDEDVSRDLAANVEDASSDLSTNDKDASGDLAAIDKDASDDVVTDDKDASGDVIANDKDVSDNLVTDDKDASDDVVTDDKDASDDVVTNEKDASSDLVTTDQDASRDIATNGQDVSGNTATTDIAKIPLDEQSTKPTTTERTDKVDSTDTAMLATQGETDQITPANVSAEDQQAESLDEDVMDKYKSAMEEEFRRQSDIGVSSKVAKNIIDESKRRQRLQHLGQELYESELQKGLDNLKMNGTIEAVRQNDQDVSNKSDHVKPELHQDSIELNSNEEKMTNEVNKQDADPNIPEPKEFDQLEEKANESNQNTEIESPPADESEAKSNQAIDNSAPSDEIEATQLDSNSSSLDPQNEPTNPKQEGCCVVL